jgi:hypothetical protein
MHGRETATATAAAAAAAAVYTSPIGGQEERAEKRLISFGLG